MANDPLSGAILPSVPASHRDDEPVPAQDLQMVEDGPILNPQLLGDTVGVPWLLPKEIQDATSHGAPAGAHQHPVQYAARGLCRFARLWWHGWWRPPDPVLRGDDPIPISPCIQPSGGSPALSGDTGSATSGPLERVCGGPGRSERIPRGLGPWSKRGGGGPVGPDREGPCSPTRRIQGALPSLSNSLHPPPRPCRAPRSGCSRSTRGR